jgi:hypothetical protein
MASNVEEISDDSGVNTSGASVLTPPERIRIGDNVEIRRDVFDPSGAHAPSTPLDRRLRVDPDAPTVDRRQSNALATVDEAGTAGPHVSSDLAPIKRRQTLNWSKYFAKFASPTCSLLPNANIITKDKYIKLQRLERNDLLGNDPANVTKRANWAAWEYEYLRSVEHGEVQLDALPPGRNFRSTLGDRVISYLLQVGGHEIDVVLSDEELIKLLVTELEKSGTRLITSAPSDLSLVVGKFKWELNTRMSYEARWGMMVSDLKVAIKETPGLQFSDRELAGALFRELPKDVHAWILSKFVKLSSDEQTEAVNDLKKLNKWVVDQWIHLDDKSNEGNFKLSNMAFPLINTYPQAAPLFPTEASTKTAVQAPQQSNASKPRARKIEATAVSSTSKKAKSDSKPFERPPKVASDAPFTCYNCNREGHNAKKCPSKCKFCGVQNGNHSAFFCDKNPNAKRGKPAADKAASAPAAA